MSFVRESAPLTILESDDDALSSIESVTNKDDLDNSLNSVTSRNLLLEYDSGPDQARSSNHVSKFQELFEIQETNELAIPTTSIVINEPTTSLKNEAKKLRSGPRLALLDKSDGSNDENSPPPLDNPTMKASVIANTAAREIMSKVYNTYTELELPGNILYIYQIHPNHGKSRATCFSCCRKSCGSVCFCFSGRCCGTKSNPYIQYDSRWASPDEFKKILITNRMLMDHFPNTVEDALSYFNTTDRLVV